MNMESSNISQSRRKGPFSGEKGPLIWQSRFTLVLLQVNQKITGESVLHNPMDLQMFS